MSSVVVCVEGEQDEVPPLSGTKASARTPNKTFPTAGILSTAGGLVFSGSDEGNFFALDAASGAPLWEFQTGGSIGANPISFTLDGHQCVAIAADRVLYVFGL